MMPRPRLEQPVQNHYGKLYTVTVEVSGELIKDDEAAVRHIMTVPFTTILALLGGKMSSQRIVVIITAVAETLTGLAFLLAPHAMSGLLFGTAPDNVGLMLGRLAGMALVAIGIFCGGAVRISAWRGFCRARWIINSKALRLRVETPLRLSSLNSLVMSQPFSLTSRIMAAI
jgi:hypothetical protein